MNDVQKMFRTIVNGQSAMKTELLGEIKKLDKKIEKGIEEVKMEIEENRKRIDKIGLQVANLEDDAPTIKEFDKLDVRVTNLEQRAISI